MPFTFASSNEVNMNHNPQHVIARWTVKPGHLSTVLATLEHVIRESRAEEGNLLYTVHQSVEDPHQLLLYEIYASEQAVEAHRAAAHFQQGVLGTVVPLLQSREVLRLQPVAM